MKKNNRSCIGITGTNASGKGEVVSILQSKGFSPLSLSDLLREILQEKGLPLDRDHLTRIGKEQREQHGPGFLADLAVKNILQPSIATTPEKKFVIDSIRHPEEVRILHEHLPCFELWAIDADIEIRFERSQKRGREENAHTLEDFIAQENQEKTNNPNAQQLHNTAELATHTILNNESVKSFHEKIERLLYA